MDAGRPTTGGTRDNRHFPYSNTVEKEKPPKKRKRTILCLLKINANIELRPGEQKMFKFCRLTRTVKTELHQGRQVSLTKTFPRKRMQGSTTLAIPTRSSFSRKDYKAAISFGLSAYCFATLSDVFEMRAGPRLPRVILVKPNWLTSTRVCDCVRQKHASNERVKVARTILLHVRMG